MNAMKTARITMMSAPRVTARNAAKARPPENAAVSSTMPKACRPIVRKIPLSRTRVMVCQFCWEKRLFVAEIVAARRRETTRPATTAATRPEPPRCSAGIEAMKGIAKEKTVSAEGSLMRARRRTPTSPTTQPMRGRDTERDGDLADEQARVEGVFVGGQAGAHRGGEQDERGRVVEEPLAFEHCDDAVGDAGAFRDRDGDRVRRRQDRAQCDAPGQGDRGDQPVDDEADREGGQEHEGNREHRDGVHLAPEVHGRHTHGRREQQRRQHHLEDDVRLDLDGPHLRQEPDRQANDQQDQGGCHAHLGRDELACHDDEHSGHGDKKGFHRSIVLRATPPASLPSHHSGYARRELARRTTPRPPALDTIPGCQTDPHDQSRC